MYTRWTSHLRDPKEKSDFENQVRHAKPVLDRILQIIEEDEKTLDKYATSVKDFDTPNWANKQAFRNGIYSYMTAMKTLNNLDQQKESIHNDR